MTQQLFSNFSEEFLNKYKTTSPPFGYNGLGYVVFQRTYSRFLDDESRKEEWWETVKRCIEGAQKIGAKYTQEEAERLFDHIFNLRTIYAGRLLWQLGTKTVDRYGGASLINCWAVKITKPEDFSFLFENLMMGGGVGFSVRREHIHELPRLQRGVSITHENTNDADFIVPDSREGWVSLLDKIIDSYFRTGKSFSYSTKLIRPAGVPLKQFGGVSSGPKPLIDGITNLCTVLTKREGLKLRSTDVLDICTIIGGIVVAGGIRRSSLIALGDWDDISFLKAKRWDLGKIPPWRQNSNNTICADEPDDILPQLWTGYKGNGEPYGLFNLPLSQKYGRLKDNLMRNSDLYPRTEDPAELTNPCFSGDTLVAVADGRGAVPIKQLAEEGKDVPVYSINSEGIVEIKWGRHPRITGTDSPLLNIEFDNGTNIKVTPNHKFPLKNGQAVEAKDLRVGDSLFRFTKKLEKINKTGKEYLRVYCDTNNPTKNKVFEHRMILKFFDQETYNSLYDENEKNGWIDGGVVCHHKDYNPTNNSPDNLVWMSFKDHVKFHGKMDNSGNKNPKFSGLTNKEIENEAIKLTKNLGRRFSTREWEKHCDNTGVPKRFSSYRKNGWFKSIAQLSVWAALKCEIRNSKMDTRTQRHYLNALEQGYDVMIIDNSLYVSKRCELCSSRFSIPWLRREASYCGRDCFNTILSTNQDIGEKRTQNMKQTYYSKQKETKQKQIMQYKDLQNKLERNPLKREWENECKKNNIPFRFKSTSEAYENNPYAMHGFKELQEEAELYNHRIISITPLQEKETVYNITVDDNHTIGIVTTFDNMSCDGIFSFQCGEISLASFEGCNLSELCLNNIRSKEGTH
jgi:hypothetical protein